ncbi:MAG TPA: CheR family methyltransferase [Pseudonocardiaceae bacterium]|nr:CheR family methyltransferase [Pseudonocardiaceae bacterium]
MTEPDPVNGADGDLEDLLTFIRDSRGFDFTGYKRSSLARRIRKRMQDVGIPDYVDYQDRLESSAEEFRYLFNTILINVTSFFRDTDTWTYLQHEILPNLLAGINPTEEIRVWSAGCSSGEEAYSLAIVLAEALGIEECVRRVKIYGTDVDEEALREARSGLYPAKSLDAMPEELRHKYFEANGAQFVLRSDLRRRVIFGRHDITRDAPISRLDLLVCRNTLMYFNVEAQSKIIDRFHFALRQGGYLFLGKAEMLLSDGNRFEVANMRQRVFRRRPGSAGPQHQPASVKLQVNGGVEVREAGRRHQLRDLALEAAPYAMLGVDVDGAVSVLNSQIRSQFGLTSQDVGRPLRDLEISYRPTELRSLIEQAQTEHRTVRVNGVQRRVSADEVQYLDILVQPLWAENGLSVGVAVAFLDTTTPTRLALEVKSNREELETAYEELQSTNEELETTNEELQSGNEELETMNEEMRIRTAELDEARTFMHGVLSSVAAGVVVLDAELRVRSWNRGAEDLWGLRSDEVNQQGYFTLEFGLPSQPVREMVQHCLESGCRSGPVAIEAVNRIGRTITCTVACSPLEGHPKGVVLLMEES